jgi:O-antigen/teichoic acid export membrane protein
MDDTVRTRPAPAADDADDGAGAGPGRARQTVPLPAAVSPTVAPPATPADAEATPDAAQALIRRAPSGYLWNQAYGLWLFVSALLIEVLWRRSLSQGEAGIYLVISVTAQSGVTIFAFGLSSAGQVFVPRALAEGGPARAMAVVVRLVIARLVSMLALCVGLLWGLGAAAQVLANTHLPLVTGLAQSVGNSLLIGHRVYIAVFILSTGISNILAQLLIGLLRTRIIFVVGGLALLTQFVLVFLFLRVVGASADAVLLAQALPLAASIVVYALALQRVLRMRPDAGGQRILGPMLRFGVAAWLADLPATSLVKPIAVGQLAAVTPLAETPLFDVSYQMGDAGNQFFTEGLGGVSLAVMSAAYARQQVGPLGTAWRTVSKLEVLLAIPVVAFAVPNAAAILRALYGAAYGAAGPFLALFLILNGVVQVLGGSTHDWALYAQGRQRWVVLARWGSVAVLAGAGLLLTPRFHVVGALMAVGLSRVAATAALLLLARTTVRRAYPAGFAVRAVLASVVPAVPLLFWHPTSLRGLVLAGLLYTAIFLVCLRLLRPLDAEDAALLAQVPAPLQVILRPFASARPTGDAAGHRPALAGAATRPPASVPPAGLDDGHRR